MIDRHNNSTLGSDRVVEFIFLDGEHTHGGDGFDSFFFTEVAMLSS